MIGQTFKHYRVRAKLGAGGMGEVFLADDLQLGRRAALKFLTPQASGDVLAERRLMVEARAAATLDHPNICSVYEVGDADGRPYIAMQYVEGETLDVRLLRAPLSLREAITLVVQVVDALAEAHAHGILHRDVKPGNIMLTTRGDAKVMDFGLAKQTSPDAGASSVETLSQLTGNRIVGTVPYMSPEQARGEPLDARSDLFSVGVLLYELLTGQRPFQGKSSAEVTAAILTWEPHPVARFAPETPPELERIVGKLLKKAPDSRYQTAKDLLNDLRALKEELDFRLKLGRTPIPATTEPVAPAASSADTGARAAPVGRGWPRMAVAVGIIAVAGAGWLYWRASRLRHAREELAQIAVLAESKRLFEAYDRAQAVERLLPGDAALLQLMPAISDSVSVATTPAGAAVYLRRFTRDAPSERQLVGTTPVSNLRIARGEYILSLEKPGYASIERSVSGIVTRASALTITPPPIRLAFTLQPASAQPERMVFVPGGDYRLVAWSRPTDRRVRLTSFFIDKYEVSNREYKEFIDAGGYLKRELWKYSVAKDGRPLSWEASRKILVDRTGLPGPRSWSNQSFAEGKAEHPVTDITWYEAAAYAALRGKQLPTAFQWEKAARDGIAGMAGVSYMPWGVFYPGDALPGRANFGTATLPTTSSEFGMSPYGAYNMAGNVAEWTANDSSDGFLATGGAWGDPVYTFSLFGGRPGLFSSDKLGFRCARNATDAASDQGGARIEIAQEVPVYSPSTDSTFQSLAAGYRYEKSGLDAKLEATQDTAEWRREKISFKGANGTRALAYLYLPHHVARPLQVLQLVPAADVERGFRSLPDAIDDRMGSFVRAGRAAFGVVLEGYIERLRPEGFVYPRLDTVEFAELIASRITDLRRGLDYLETRPELDTTRMAVVAPSAGSSLGMILLAIEPRYRAVVFVGAGLPESYKAIVAGANPIQFASHIRVPKLIVQGRYDEDSPIRTAGEPLFKLLTEPKRIFLYEGGHVPSLEVMMSATSGWLDENLGPVAR